MSRMIWISGLLASCVAFPFAAGHAQAAAQQDARAVLERALRAGGGELAFRSLLATRAEVQTAHFQLGQETRPGGLPVMDVRIGTAVHDLANMRLRFSGEHRGGARWGVRFSSVPFLVLVTPSAGFEQQGRWLNAAGPEWARAQSDGLRLRPERILLTALAAHCINVGRRGSLGAPNETGPTLRCTGQGLPDTVTLHFDGVTGHLAATAMRAHDPMRGRYMLVTRYGEYQPVMFDQQGTEQRLLLPRSVVVEIDGRVRSATQLGEVAVIAAPSDSVFAIPDSLRSRREPSIPTPNVTRLADGVFHVGSGEYYTLVVVQGDSLVLLEAPDTPERARVLMQAIRTQVSNAPVKLVVNSHHHLDHTGGLLHAFAERTLVMTHWANVEHLRRFARANGPNAGAEPRLLGVRDSVVVGSGERAVHIYSAPNWEGEAFLVGYMPALRLLWAADVGEGGAGVELRRVVRTLGLRVDRVAPGHVPAWNWPSESARSLRQ